MALKLIFVLLIFALAVDAGRMTWQDCDDDDSVKILAVSISPHPLRTGRTARIGGRFRVEEATGTNFNLILTYAGAGRRFSVRRGFRCNQLVGARCPLRGGTFNLRRFTSRVPNGLPNGRYTLTADLRDRRNNKRVACARVGVDVRR